MMIDPKAWSNGVIVLLAYIVILGRVFREREKAELPYPLRRRQALCGHNELLLTNVELLLLIVSVVFTLAFCLITWTIETFVTLSFALGLIYLISIYERLSHLMRAWMIRLEQRALS